MRYLRHLLFACLLLLILSPLLHAADRDVLRPLAFCIPRTEKPPTIDGVIHDEEWKDALALTGVLSWHEGHTYNARQVLFWITWDDEHFYIAMRSPNLPGEKLRRAVRVAYHDEGDIVFDDTMELYFYPQSYRQKIDGFYQLLINSVNRVYDCKRCPSIGQDFYAWTANWPLKNRITPDGKYWEAEIAVNIKDMEAPGPMKAGDRWGILPARNFASPSWQQVALWTASYFIPDGYPQMTLATDIPVVQCRDFGDVLHGDIHPDLRIANPTKAVAPVQGTLAVKQNGTVVQDCPFTAQLAPGQELRPDLHIALPNAKKGDNYECALKVLSGDRVLYDDWFPFEIGHASLNYLQYKAPDTPFAFSGGLDPARNTFSYNIDLIDFAQKEQYDHALISVTDAAGQQIARVPAARVIEDASTGLAPLPSLKVGEYHAEAVLYDKANAVLSSQKVAFNKLDEAKEFPWYHNTLGDTDAAFYPFPPMTVKGSAVSCWGRTTTYTGCALPAQITSQGVPLLTRPLSLVLERENTRATLSARGAPKVTSAKSGKVTLTGAGQLAKMTAAVTTTEELDGWTWMEMTLTPKGAVPVDKLYLDIPLKSELTPLLSAAGASYGDGLARKVPPGEGRLWSSQDFTINCMTKGSFIPLVWLGDDQRGLCWFADDDQGWTPSDRTPAVEVMRTGDEVVLRLNLISEPETLTAPRTIRWGLIASPMKPQLPGFRFAEVNFSSAFGVVGMDNSNWSDTIPNKPYEDSKKQVEQMGALWPYVDSAANVTPCICSGWICTSDRKALNYFRGEIDGTPTRTEQDLYLYNLKQWVERAGIAGIYHDCFAPRKSTNLTGGGAYRLPDGALQPGWNLTRSREFLKRLWVMLLQSGHTPPDIRCNGGTVIPSLGFILKSNMGESSFFVTESRDFDFQDMWPQKELFQVWNPHTFGMTLNWMQPNGTWMSRVDQSTSQGRAAAEYHLRVMCGYLLAHDITRVNGGYERVNIPLLSWGMNKPDVTFYPYWRPLPFASCPSRDVLMSAWSRPDKVLFVIDNTLRSDTEVTVHVDYRKAGVWPQRGEQYLGVYDLETGAALPFDAFTGNITVRVPAREFRLVAVERF